jgi:hypothetical protein
MMRTLGLRSAANETEAAPLAKSANADQLNHWRTFFM